MATEVFYDFDLQKPIYTYQPATPPCAGAGSLFWRLSTKSRLPDWCSSRGDESSRELLACLAAAEHADAQGFLDQAINRYQEAVTGLLCQARKKSRRRARRVDAVHGVATSPGPPPLALAAVIAATRLGGVLLRTTRVVGNVIDRSLAAFRIGMEGGSSGLRFAAAELNAGNLLRRVGDIAQAAQLYEQAMDTGAGAVPQNEGQGLQQSMWWDAWRHCNEECGRRAKYQLGILLLQTGNSEPGARLLQDFGLRYHLCPRVWAQPVPALPLSPQLDRKPTPVAATAPARQFRSAVPADTAQTLQAAFAEDAPFWSETGYHTSERGYFSFWVDMRRGPRAGCAVDKLARRVAKLAGLTIQTSSGNRNHHRQIRRQSPAGRVCPAGLVHADGTIHVHGRRRKRRAIATSPDSWSKQTIDACDNGVEINANEAAASSEGSASLQAIGYEWWVHRRDPAAGLGLGHRLHFDTAEQQLKGGQLLHPIQSSVVYLAGSDGGPTVVIDQCIGGPGKVVTPGQRGWSATPEQGSVLLFNGELLHCVLPPPAPPSTARLTIMFGFWAHDVSQTTLYGPCGPMPKASDGFLWPASLQLPLSAAVTTFREDEKILELAVPVIEPIWYSASDRREEQIQERQENLGQIVGTNADDAILLSSSDDEVATADALSTAEVAEEKFIESTVATEPSQNMSNDASDCCATTVGRRGRNQRRLARSSMSLDNRWKAAVRLCEEHGPPDALPPHGIDVDVATGSEEDTPATIETPRPGVLQLRLQCPQGATPGTILQLQLGKQIVPVEVPPRVSQGDHFLVEIDLPPTENSKNIRQAQEQNELGSKEVDELPWGIDELYSMRDPSEYRNWLLCEYDPWSASTSPEENL